MSMTNGIPASDRTVAAEDNMLITPQWLASQHDDLERRLQELESKLLNGVIIIDSDAAQTEWADFLKDVDAFNRDVEGLRISTKEPYLAATRVIDGFFKAFHNKDAKGNTSSMGRGDRIIHAVSGAMQSFMRLKAEAERKRREEEARLAREAEAKARREQEEAERKQREHEAEQRRLQAEADRLADSRRKADREKAAAAQREADRKQREADAERERNERAAAEANEAAMRANEETARAGEKSADLARSRGTRSLSTLQDVWKFEIVDPDQVKGAPLWPYLKREHIEYAIGQFMKAQAPKEEPEGGWKPKGLDGVRFYRTADLRRR